jgi:hypothetical protein
MDFKFIDEAAPIPDEVWETLFARLNRSPTMVLTGGTMNNRIRLAASFVITDSDNFEEMLNHKKQDLARLLAKKIVELPGVIRKREATKEHLSYYEANCYVLTPKDFSILVEQIRYDVLRGVPPMMGGVYGTGGGK